MEQDIANLKMDY